MASDAQATKLEYNPRSSFDQSEPIPEPYSEVGVDTIVSRALYALPAIFGIPRGLVTSDFEAWCKTVLNRRHPFLHCSAARAVFEGRIPGLPKPTHHLRASKLMQQAMYLLDMFETLVCDYMRYGDKSAKRDPGGDECKASEGGDATGREITQEPKGTTGKPQGGTDLSGEKVRPNEVASGSDMVTGGRSHRSTRTKRDREQLSALK